jgi:hypothetical protein
LKETHVIAQTNDRYIFQIDFFPFIFKNNTNAIAQITRISSKPGVFGDAGVIGLFAI